MKPRDLTDTLSGVAASARPEMRELVRGNLIAAIPAALGTGPSSDTDKSSSTGTSSSIDQ